RPSPPSSSRGASNTPQGASDNGVVNRVYTLRHPCALITNEIDWYSRSLATQRLQSGHRLIAVPSLVTFNWTCSVDVKREGTPDQRPKRRNLRALLRRRAPQTRAKRVIGRLVRQSHKGHAPSRSPHVPHVPPKQRRRSRSHGPRRVWRRPRLQPGR